jgi:hypothetical protein
VLIYADFYAPIVDFATSPDRYGFNGTDGNGALKACCGDRGGRYNFNLTALCGMPGVRGLGRRAPHRRWLARWPVRPFAHIKHELVA